MCFKNPVDISGTLDYNRIKSDSGYHFTAIIYKIYKEDSKMSTIRYDLTAKSIHTDSDKAKLLYISTAKYGGDWFSAMHTHACAEIFYVVGGKGQFLVRGDSFPVTVGDMVIVNPNVEHTETSLASNPLEYIVMGIEGLELKMDDPDQNSFCIVNFYDSSDHIQIYLKNILFEIEHKLPGFETVCQDLLDILLIKLLRRTNFSKVLASSQEHFSADAVAVRRYIEGHFREPLTLDTLAKEVHINKFHLAHMFSREFGISPINYIQKLRIEESRELLCTTNYALSRIAQVCGYSSPSYFSQRFRQAEGMSPAEFRRKHRQQEAESAREDGTPKGGL